MPPATRQSSDDVGPPDTNEIATVQRSSHKSQMTDTRRRSRRRAPCCHSSWWRCASRPETEARRTWSLSFTCSARRCESVSQLGRSNPDFPTLSAWARQARTASTADNWSTPASDRPRAADDVFAETRAAYLVQWGTVCLGWHRWLPRQPPVCCRYYRGFCCSYLGRLRC